MIDRNDLDAFLAAYADGELDADQTVEVEALLATDPAARNTVAMHRETAALLRAAFAEGQYRADVGVMPKPVHVRRRVPGYAWAIAASLLLGLVGYGAGATWPDLVVSDRDRMLSEVAEYHAVYSRETVHLVEVPAAQSDHLKAWLGKRVNGTLVIPDFKQAGLTFAGGRLVVLDGAPVAELMYTREKGLPIAFCVLSHPGAPGKTILQRRGATNLATWADGSHSYIVVGEADQALIGNLAEMARTQL
jgi:anti-sigma factor RsiW